MLVFLYLNFTKTRVVIFYFFMRFAFKAEASPTGENTYTNAYGTRHCSCAFKLTELTLTELV